MGIKEDNETRIRLNEDLIENDEFFKIFGSIDDQVYSEGEIPKKYKELTGLSISVFSRCNECILYHMQNCIEQGASKKQIIESIKIGVVGGGSVSYPNARYAMNVMNELML
jgi:AhpD family alkylhydroperoxidase